MSTIYKYPLRVTEQQLLTLPKNAEILTVQLQNDIACLWALIDNNVSHTEYRNILIVGTGHVILLHNLIYISTFQLNDGSLVFHVFEVK